ncbi:Protein of unknown function [Pyronema omphalodes CBS 100304]|uniref:Uncharacterized protein n=1 Tax=Pyronema omphalodes (strain CBS 100304) TaxID=1076935 RepID=U4KUB3_PYROM|nr:Protein of unknown function [Pyronema omphalodes CBS 100304]
MGKELKRLRAAMLLHIQLIQVAVQTLQFKDQNGIAQRQEEYHLDLKRHLDEQMKRFYSVPRDLSRSNTAMLNLGGSQVISTGRTRQSPPPQEVIQEFAWLDQSFASRLPPEYATNMQKMVDTCIWWYLEGQSLATTNENDQDLFYQRYINLSKSHWLLRKVTAMKEFRQQGSEQ